MRDELLFDPPHAHLALSLSRSIFNSLSLSLSKSNSAYAVGRKLPIHASFSQIAHLGTCYPLYFQFLIYSGLILLIVTCFASIYQIIQNYSGNMCRILEGLSLSSEDQCTASLITRMATTNREITKPDQATSVINLVLVIVLMFFAQFYRRKQNKLIYETDKSDVNVSDYSIFVNNIPLTSKSDDVKEYFAGLAAKLHVPLEIEKINMCYNVRPYKQLKSSLYKKIIRQYSQILSVQQKSELEKQIQTEKSDIEKIEEQCRKEEVPHCGCCFISFKKEQMVIDVLKFFKQSLIQRLFTHYFLSEDKMIGKQKLSVIRALDPAEIQWDNLSFSLTRKITMRTISFIISAGLLAGSFFVIYEIQKWQATQIKKGDDTSTTVYVYIIQVIGSMIILVINITLSQLIYFLGKKELYNTKTDYFISVAIKLGVSSFFNTAMITFIINELQYGNNFAIDGGLIFDVWILMITNVFFPPIMSFLDLGYVFKYIQQIYYKKRNYKLNQQQANKLYEYSKMDPAARYPFLFVLLFVLLFLFLFLFMLLFVFLLLLVFLLFEGSRSSFSFAPGA